METETRQAMILLDTGRPSHGSTQKPGARTALRIGVMAAQHYARERVPSKYHRLMHGATDHEERLALSLKSSHNI